MGGREVGGLANMLAAHMGFSEAERDRVRRFWNAPNLVSGAGPEGRRHVRCGRRRPHQGAVGDGHQPGGVAAARGCGARRRWPSSICWSSPRTSPATTRLRHAHVRLPAAAWGEKDGTVTNSERCISRQRAFLPLPGSARPDWWMLSEVARRLGYGEAFAFRSATEIFEEHARLSGFENEGDARLRYFRCRRLEQARRSTTSSRSSGRCRAGACADRAPVRRRRLLHQGSQGALRGHCAAAAVGVPCRTSWPFVLNTGRVRDQWHTMTRTGLSPRLSTHIAEPFVEIHPDDAGAPGAGAGHAGAGRDDRTARPCCACWSIADSSRARCSCRCTGRPRTAPRAASARWCSRRPIPSPASPRPRRRRRASRRSPLRTTASCCRAARCNPARSPIGRRHAQPSATFSTSRWMSRARAGALAARDPAGGRSP